MLTALFVSINATNYRSAETQAVESLGTAERVFRSILDLRSRRLAEGAYVLSSDFAFKQAIAIGDFGTTLSALENLGRRIDSEVMILVSLDSMVLADTSNLNSNGMAFSNPDLIVTAEEYGDASSIVFYGGRTLQMIVVPLLAPDPMAWLCVSFPIDKPLVDELRRLTQAHVSLIRVKKGESTTIASTLPDGPKAELSSILRKTQWTDGTSQIVQMYGQDYVSLSSTIFSQNNSQVIAILQRSLDEGLKPFFRQRIFLLMISAFGLVISVVGGIVIARKVSGPVKNLVKGAREIGRGNYEYNVEQEQKDEIGELAGAFNDMTKGLLERDKSRNLLGKIVSPNVASELLARDEVKLGGEERYMTALFSDIAGFTSISEKKSPSALVTLLNEYLSGMTDDIYKFDGTVDKYIGDAIVAFWGAPLFDEYHAEHAVQAAVVMQRRLNQLRKSWIKRGEPEIFVRIGINTGLMVVGNMGSKDRLDYTIMGDTVNLAARLEGVNKYYGTGVMISEYTCAAISDKFLLRELDLVKVQGKEEAIRIFEVVEEIERTSVEQQDQVMLFAEAVMAFRNMEFKKAETLFKKYNNWTPQHDQACAIYRTRISEFKSKGVPDEWDFAYSLSK